MTIVRIGKRNAEPDRKLFGVSGSNLVRFLVSREKPERRARRKKSTFRSGVKKKVGGRKAGRYGRSKIRKCELSAR